MLRFEIDGDVLHVTEFIHGCQIQWADNHWYYNVSTWQVSSHGKLGDVPDRDMVPAAIEWVKKYYLPHVNNSGE